MLTQSELVYTALLCTSAPDFCDRLLQGRASTLLIYDVSFLPSASALILVLLALFFELLPEFCQQRLLLFGQRPPFQ